MFMYLFAVLFSLFFVLLFAGIVYYKQKGWDGLDIAWVAAVLAGVLTFFSWGLKNLIAYTITHW